jgi:hypothetical protein
LFCGDFTLRRCGLRIFTLLLLALSAPAFGEYSVATFQADVTIPMGHACMGGGIAAASEVVDPLYAKGLVFKGADDPIVFLAVDWCEIRNDAYDRWREVLAETAGTSRERVLLAAVHQHDAPVADLRAQELLTEHELPNALCDPAFHETAVQKTAAALKEALAAPKPVTHYGVGVGEVKELASNRRVLAEDGRPVYWRGSATPDQAVREQPVGTIDPMLRTLSFWNGNEAVAAMHAYAVHPMSYYGKGGVSYDFPGMAREKRQADDPEVFQIYFSGCSGDVVAGKWNDGDPANRQVLADKLYDGMVRAWEDTERHRIDDVTVRVADLVLPLRNDAGFAPEAMASTLANGDAKTFDRNLAAMGMSWRERVEGGQVIDVPAVDFGEAIFLLLPAESFVQYQLTAQEMRPDAVVLTAGYGESAPGYIPSQAATDEDFNAHHTWCWVGEDAEKAMHGAMREALGAGGEIQNEK